MRRSFTINEFYHLFNRGVDKRKIFLDKNDYIRFIHDLYEFNNTNPALPFSQTYKLVKTDQKAKNVRSRVSNIEQKDGRDNLVKVHAYVLMPNHHHVLVEQVKEKGVSIFMRKLHTGYTNSFNQKYKRKGHLFQGPFKSIHIKDDIHFGFLICYLHANPLELWKRNWKQKKLGDSEIKQALRFLEKYKYSSYLDYSGKKNFPLVISKDFLLDFFDGVKGYNEFFMNWLKQYQKNIKYLKEDIIE